MSEVTIKKPGITARQCVELCENDALLHPILRATLDETKGDSPERRLRALRRSVGAIEEEELEEDAKRLLAGEDLYLHLYLPGPLTEAIVESSASEQIQGPILEWCKNARKLHPELRASLEQNRYALDEVRLSALEAAAKVIVSEVRTYGDLDLLTDLVVIIVGAKAVRCGPVGRMSEEICKWLKVERPSIVNMFDGQSLAGAGEMAKQILMEALDAKREPDAPECHGAARNICLKMARVCANHGWLDKSLPELLDDRPEPEVGGCVVALTGAIVVLKALAEWNVMTTVTAEEKAKFIQALRASSPEADEREVDRFIDVIARSSDFSQVLMHGYASRHLSLIDAIRVACESPRRRRSSDMVRPSRLAGAPSMTFLDCLYWLKEHDFAEICWPACVGEGIFMGAISESVLEVIGREEYRLKDWECKLSKYQRPDHCFIEFAVANGGTHVQDPYALAGGTHTPYIYALAAPPIRDVSISLCEEDSIVPEEFRKKYIVDIHSGWICTPFKVVGLRTEREFLENQEGLDASGHFKVLISRGGIPWYP